jgi:hypothetical protein
MLPSWPIAASCSDTGIQVPEISIGILQITHNQELVVPRKNIVKVLRNDDEPLHPKALLCANYSDKKATHPTTILALIYWASVHLRMDGYLALLQLLHRSSP